MRKPLVIVIVFCLGLILWPLLFITSMFRVTPPKTLNELIGAEPLPMKSIGDGLKDFLESEDGRAVRDSWGYAYGPPNPLDPSAFGYEVWQAEAINRAAELLGQGQASRALSLLDGRYAAYPPLVKKKSFFEEDEEDEDELPESEDRKLLYLNTRYTRAAGKMMQAELNSRRGSAVTGLLQEALYDLRRSVNAVETLGDVRGKRGNYWGSGAHAWEGQALKLEHGGLPASAIYGNLALAYLRLGEKGGYPYRAPAYLERERDKYSWGEDRTLTPIVNGLIDYATKGEARKKMPLRFFRLIMALHNLEAAGRGSVNNADADVHQYTVALILNHLSDYPESGVTLNTAMDYFKLARSSSNASRPIYHLAGKELVLLMWRSGRAAEAAEVLETLDLGQLESLIAGPDREQGLLFLDMAQLTSLSKGDFERVRNHLDSRDHELPGGKARKLHQEVLAVVGQAFFHDLIQRLRDDSIATWGGVVQNFRSDPVLERLPEFREVCQRDFLDHSESSPWVAINLMVRQTPSLRIWFWLLRLGGFGLWVWYLIWCYRSHRKVAQQMFTSNYGREIA